jgi:hypothetical protein
MWNNHDSKKLLASLLAVLVSFVSSHSLAAKGGQEEPLPVEISIILWTPWAPRRVTPYRQTLGIWRYPSPIPRKFARV